LPGDELVAALPSLATFDLKDHEDFRAHHGLRILGADWQVAPRT
jgi:hypothetical protein